MKNYTLLLIGFLLSLTAPAQQPQLVIPVGHTSYLNYFAISPDGRHILTAGSDRTTRLWDRDGRLITTLRESANNEVLTVGFSPDGQHLLTAGSGGAKLWNLSGEPILIFPGSYNTNHALFSPDGQRVAAGSTDGIVNVWDINGKRLWRERVFKPSEEEESATARELAFSPDGAYLAAIQETWTQGVAMIWDKQYKKTADIQLGEKISSLVFAPGGDTLLTGSINGQIHVWSLNGALIKDFHLHNKEVMSLAAHPKTGYLSGSDDNTAVRFNLDGKKLQAYPHNAAVRLAAFSSAGDEILSFSDATEAMLFWSLDGKVTHRLNGYGADVLSIAPGPDGGKLLVGTSNGARIWDLRGRDILQGLPHHAKVDEVAYSPDGRRLYTVGWDGRLDIFLSKDSLLHTAGLKGMQGVSLSVSRDGQYILTSTADGRAVLWDSLGQEIREVAAKDYRTRAAAFSPDGQLILTASELLDARLWETQTGTQIKTLPHNTGVEAALISPDGQYMLTRSKDDKIRLWDSQGEMLWEDGGWELFEGRASFSPDSKYMAIPNGKNTILMGVDKMPADTLAGHTGVVNTAVFSPDGKRIFTGGKDGMLKIWDSGSGKEIATLIQLGAKDWAVTSPSGLFDASPGAMQLMYYNVQNEAIALSQLDERYYAPGLLATLMGYNEAALKDISKFDSVKLYPQADLRIANDELVVKLKERSGGIGKYSILINNKEVVFSENKEKQTEIRLNLKDYTRNYLPGPDNSVSVLVYNEAGWLKSAPVRLNYTPEYVASRGGNQDENPPPAFAFEAIKDAELYAVCIGTSDYQGDKLDLLYPDKDAEAMHQALLASGGALFGAKAVHSYLLNTGKASGTLPSSKENIEATLKEIAKNAWASDIILIYFSGHGVAYAPPGEESQFYYLTGSIGSEDLSDPEIRKEGAISTEELREWAKEISALKQILIFDACNSGKVLEDLGSASKDLNAGQILALERMKDRTGMFVLSGSAADKSSYEASRYGQGLLTFSLLQGMEYVSRTGNGLVDVSQLFRYSLEKVPELAEGIGGMQTPRMAPPEGGQSFYIGIVNDTVAIPIAQEKPVFIRPNIKDKKKYWTDPLGLEESVSTRFRNESAKGARSGLAYFDLPKYKNSYQIIGHYEQGRDEVAFKGVITRSDIPDADPLGELEWKGPGSQLEKMVDSIIAQANGFLNQKER